jgi:hypothetical protein
VPKPNRSKQVRKAASVALRIELCDIEPLIWRRIVVPTSWPMSTLHNYVQWVMGWQDTHAHDFRVLDKVIAPDWWYITLDLDVLDPADAPAVANLEPLHAGLRASDVMKIFHGLRGLDVIGADIVCMIPSKDNPNNITAMNAMALMFEMISLIADRFNAAGQTAKNRSPGETALTQ